MVQGTFSAKVGLYKASFALNHRIVLQAVTQRFTVKS